MKLVRDFIPIIIEKSGGSCKWRYTQSDAEFVSRLVDKMSEETLELVESENLQDATEEAGDLYEVFKTLIEHKGVSFDDARAAARLKRVKRGGFKSGIVLESSSSE